MKNADASKKCAQHWESVKEEILKEQSEDPEDEDGEEEEEEQGEEELQDYTGNSAESYLRGYDSADCISTMLETIKNEQIDNDIKLEILSKAVYKIKKHMFSQVADD